MNCNSPPTPTWTRNSWGSSMGAEFNWNWIILLNRFESEKNRAARPSAITIIQLHRLPIDIFYISICWKHYNILIHITFNEVQIFCMYLNCSTPPRIFRLARCPEISRSENVPVSQYFTAVTSATAPTSMRGAGSFYRVTNTSAICILFIFRPASCISSPICADSTSLNRCILCAYSKIWSHDYWVL